MREDALLLGPGHGQAVTAEPVRRQRGWLATFENGPDEFGREEGQRQHLAQIFDGDSVAGGDGGEIVAFAKGSPPSLCSRDIGDQDVVFGGLRGTDD